MICQPRWPPMAPNATGPGKVRKRAEAKTDPQELALYGNGSWPHLSAYQRGELASNGNYYETDAISVRHGVCGDPAQVSLVVCPLFSWFDCRRLRGLRQSIVWWSMVMAAVKVSPHCKPRI